MTLHAVQANAACDFAFVTCVLHAAPFSLTWEGFPAWRAEMHKDPGGKGRRDLWRPLHRSATGQADSCVLFPPTACEVSVPRSGGSMGVQRRSRAAPWTLSRPPVGRAAALTGAEGGGRCSPQRCYGPASQSYTPSPSRRAPRKDSASSCGDN